MSQQRTLIVKLRALVYALTITRFNLFILVAGFALLFVGQGQDLLVEITLGEKTDWIASLSLLLGVSICAFSIWYWARVLLDVRFPDPPVDYPALKFWRIHLPRALGLLVFLGLIWNLWRAVGWQWEAIAASCLAIGYYLSVLYRRDIAQWLARLMQPEAPERHWIWADSARTKDEPRLLNVKQILGSHWVKALLALGLAMFLWGIGDPLSMGLLFNTPLLLFVWGATFLPWGSAITYIGNRSGFPLYLTLIVLAVIFSYFNDNHGIRPLTESRPAPAERPTLDMAVDRWIRANNCEQDTCPPFVVIATAGGGIRAAYWTGTVLGELHEQVPGFDKRLFAISGVSGGSVGATMYRAALEAGVAQEEMKEKLLDVLGRDYLTPVSAGLLYRDLLARFMPCGFIPDRAGTFERGLEHGFEQATGKGTMTKGFSALAIDPDAHTPALFLNSTWSDNGRRIVAANLDLSATEALYSDLLDRLGYDLRLSTAAHNSARFPLVSPPGSWQMTLTATEANSLGIEPKEGDKGKTSMLQRLQDGGLFENYGAETALEILGAARKAFRQHPNKPLFDPLVILISSDPGLPDNLAVPDLRKPANIGYEALSTFRTYAATRVGRGAEAAARLRDWIWKDNQPTRYAHFRMCNDDGQADPPLGWALSTKAQEDIIGFLPAAEPSKKDLCRHDNWARFDTMKQQISAPAKPPEA